MTLRALAKKLIMPLVLITHLSFSMNAADDGLSFILKTRQKEVTNDILNQDMVLPTLPHTDEGIKTIAQYIETLEGDKKFVQERESYDPNLAQRILTTIERQLERLRSAKHDIMPHNSENNSEANPAAVSQAPSGNLPVESEDISQECSICYENFNNGQEVAQLLCSHRFHKACIDDWFARNKNCPMCRREFSGNENPFVSSADASAIMLHHPLSTSESYSQPMHEEREPNFDGNYYEVLAVESDAAPATIKKAYHRLARIYHPDKGGDKEKFQKLSVAYTTLSDAENRAAYDRLLSHQSSSTAAKPQAPTKQSSKNSEQKARRKKARKRKGARKAGKRSGSKKKNVRKRRHNRKTTGRSTASRRNKVKRARNFDYEESLKKRTAQ